VGRTLRSFEHFHPYRLSPAEEQLRRDFTGDESELRVLRRYLELADDALELERHPRPYLISRDEK
jgi:hypothetical protein